MGSGYVFTARAHLHQVLSAHKSSPVSQVQIIYFGVQEDFVEV